jgi:hypothetical protein
MKIVSDEEAVIMISMSLNLLFIVFAWDYLKEYKKFRERISRFRTRVRQLVKKNKARYEARLQKAIIQIRHEFEKEFKKEKELRMAAQQSEEKTKNDMTELQQKIQNVLNDVFEKNKNCIESNSKTLAALKSKYVKVFDLENERSNLNEKNKQKLLEHFEEFEKKIIDEIQNSKITKEIVEKSLSEIKQKIK